MFQYVSRRTFITNIQWDKKFPPDRDFSMQIFFPQFSQNLLGSGKFALNIDWSTDMWLIGARKVKDWDPKQSLHALLTKVQIFLT